MKEYVIYKFTSPSGKSYIGQTCDFERRKKQHQSTSCSPAFANAIDKYGFENFIEEILEEHLNIDDANIQESYWIDYNNTMSPNGYNLMTGGRNCEKTEEHSAKIGLAREEWFKTDDGIAWKAVLAKRIKDKQLYDVHPLLGVAMKQSSKDMMSATKLNNPTPRTEAGKLIFKEKQEQNWANGVYDNRLKKYILISPDNIEYIVTNLKKFCIDNNLNYNSVTNIIDKRKYKGWLINSK